MSLLITITGTRNYPKAKPGNLKPNWSYDRSARAWAPKDEHRAVKALENRERQIAKAEAKGISLRKHGKLKAARTYDNKVTRLRRETHALQKAKPTEVREIKPLPKPQMWKKIVSVKIRYDKVRNRPGRGSDHHTFDLEVNLIKVGLREDLEKFDKEVVNNQGMFLVHLWDKMNEKDSDLQYIDFDEMFSQPGTSLEVGVKYEETNESEKEEVEDLRWRGN